MERNAKSLLYVEIHEDHTKSLDTFCGKIISMYLDYNLQLKENLKGIKLHRNLTAK